jgi:DNA-binding HxlR family transcriptional regulator
MPKKVQKPLDQPPQNFQKTVELIGDVWTLLIVNSLLISPKRFNELAGSIPGVNRSTLSARLKSLSDYGVLERQIGQENPPSSTYYLTPLGKGMAKIIQEINKFSAHFLD